ncbi:MAG: hypothetical protein EOO27_24905, partial [Comamonadaceae bacterium]
MHRLQRHHPRRRAGEHRRNRRRGVGVRAAQLRTRHGWIRPPTHPRRGSFMKFTNQFVVPEPIDAAWKLLADVPRIAPCLPGASVSQLSDDEYEGSIAVKVGPIKVGYTGIAKFLELDEHNHTMLLDGRGNESSGKGSAAAQIRVNLTDTGSGSTVVDVTTDLQVTGKVAQFGRSAMADIGERLIAQFAANLEAMIAGPGAETPKAQRSGTAAATAHTPTVGSAPSAAGSEL